MNFQTVVQKAWLAIVLCLSCVFADGNFVGKHNIGAGAGFVTGYGLSYRQWFERNGIQLTCAPYYNKSVDQKEFVLSIGVTGLYIIKEAKYVNLLAYYGPHFWYNQYWNRWNSYFDQTTGATISNSTTIEKSLFLGGGPGFDFHFWKISFNLMFGFVFRTDFENNSGINFSGETALYYSF
jgi:hypothetical protein